MTQLAVGIDEGFSRVKVAALNVTGLAVSDLRAGSVAYDMFRSVHAPLPADTLNVAGLMDTGDGVTGLVGRDAVLHNPTLWQADATEAHYGSQAQKLLVRSAVARALTQLAITPGDVRIWLSLGLPIMHEQHQAVVAEAFTSRFPLHLTDGRKYNVIVERVEVMPQPTWLCFDYLCKWDATDGHLQPVWFEPLLADRYLVLHDFGSKTYQGAAYHGNFTPVKRWCEPAGSWELVRDELKRRLQRKAAEAGQRLADPSAQELLTCYETGVFQRGKTPPLDMTEEIAAMIAPKVEQRIRIANVHLNDGVDVGDMLFAGGDCERNLPAFRAFYLDAIAGDMVIMSNEHGDPDPGWRCASGQLKGAIRRYAESTNGGV